jgi:hypothetical protein
MSETVGRRAVKSAAAMISNQWVSGSAEGRIRPKRCGGFGFQMRSRRAQWWNIEMVTLIEIPLFHRSPNSFTAEA